MGIQFSAVAVLLSLYVVLCSKYLLDLALTVGMKTFYVSFQFSKLSVVTASLALSPGSLTCVI